MLAMNAPPGGWGRLPPSSPGFLMDLAHPMARGLQLCLLPHAGGLWYDRSGFGRHGTLSGAVWSGAGVSLNGSSAYVDLGAFVSLSPLTVHARAYVAALTGVQQQIASKGFDGTNTEWQLTIDTSNHLQFSSFNGANFGAVSTFTPALGWSDFTGSYDGTTWRLYVNGSLVLANATSGPIATTRKLLVGAVDTAPFGILQFFGGLIERFYIYDRALSDGEVARLSREPYAFVRAPFSTATTLNVGLTKALAELLSLSDSAARALVKTCAELLSLADARTLALAKSIGQALGLSDAVAAQIVGLALIVTGETALLDAIEDAGSGDAESAGGLA